MKKRVLSFLACVAFVSAIKAQDFAADSINRQKFTGLYSAGEMSNTFLVPYFSTSKTEKGKFIIKEVDAESLRERNSTSLELPASYTLKTIGYNGKGFLTIFIDEAKKEEVFITVEQGNIVAKKSSKISGRTYKALSVMDEGYLLASVEKSGDYSIERFAEDLTSKWKKTFAAPKGASYNVLGIEIKEGNIEVVRKESTNEGKYLFTVQQLLQSEGTEQGVVNIKTDSLAPYPTFIQAKQGRLENVGYYYKNNIYSATPDGIYAAILQSDNGQVLKVAHAPYSQVIEDVKESLGSKLNDPNTTIAFKAVTAENPMENLFMSGQVITRKLTDKGATITMGDFVTVRFDNENKYVGTVVTKNKGRTINLTGDLGKVNMQDLAAWISSSGLLQLRSYAFLPGAYPIASYSDRNEMGEHSLCYTNLYKVDAEKGAMCISVINEQVKDTGTYVFGGLNIPVKANNNDGVIDHQHDSGRYYTYYFHNTAFMMNSRRGQDLHVMSIPIEIQREEQK